METSGRGDVVARAPAPPPGIYPLLGKLQHYDWGTIAEIPRLLGLAPDGRPSAELWLGAHPSAPATVQVDGRAQPLDAVIQADRDAALGGPGVELPLLKVLSAARPLSIQVHPSRSQAEAGFDAEEQAVREGRLDPSRRNYKDRNPKPEIIVALTDFYAMSGFRDVPTTLRLLEPFSDVPGMERVSGTLRAQGLRAAYALLNSLPSGDAAELARGCAETCARLSGGAGEFQQEHRWAARTAQTYPGDIGSVAMLLLNFVHLRPGEALYSGAGSLHFYLEGTGIELMASSDNVLRGGLTRKNVDREELLKVVSFEPAPPARVAVERNAAGERVYRTPAPEFRLSTIHVGGTGAGPVTPARTGPEILLCTEGCVELTRQGGTSLTLRKGQAAFVYAAAGPYTVLGAGMLFRATPG